MYGFSRRMGLNGKREDEKGKVQTVGLEPTRANTLRPERSTLDHSVTFASDSSSSLPFLKDFSPSLNEATRSRLLLFVVS